jgi:hypothetical protein
MYGENSHKSVLCPQRFWGILWHHVRSYMAWSVWQVITIMQ